MLEACSKFTENIRLVNAIINKRPTRIYKYTVNCVLQPDTKEEKAFDY